MLPACAFRNMPFREKTAWARAAILTGGAAFYLNIVISALRALGQTAPLPRRARRTRPRTSAKRSSVTGPATGQAT